MARIETYNKQTPISPSDKLLGTDGKNGKTKNFLISEMLAYFAENNEGNLRIRDNIGGAQSDISKNKVKDGVIYYILNVEKYYYVYNSKLKLLEFGNIEADNNFKIRKTVDDVILELTIGVEDGVIYYILETNKYYKVYGNQLINFTFELINEDNTLTISDGKINTNVGRNLQESSITRLAFPIKIIHEKDYSYIEDVFIAGVSIPRRFWRHYEGYLNILDFTSVIQLPVLPKYDIELKGTYFYIREE